MVSFHGCATRFYIRKLKRVANEIKQEFKYTTNLHVE